MSWRGRRQGAYLGIFFVLICVFLFVIFYPVIFKKPTCSDNKQNGTETGVDCGGQCRLYCPKTVALPRIDFAAVYPVAEDVYNVVAKLTSTESGAGSRMAGYKFTLYNQEGKVINEVRGTTFIPPASEFAVFEAGVRTGARVPVRARFSWDENQIYFEKTNVNINTLPIEVSLWDRTTILGSERLKVNISNNSLRQIPQSEYIVIVYDEKDEPLAVSKTVASLEAKSSTELFFSWPYEFKSVPKRYELIKRINPFTYAK